MSKTSTPWILNNTKHQSIVTKTSSGNTHEIGIIHSVENAKHIIKAIALYDDFIKAGEWVIKCCADDSDFEDAKDKDHAIAFLIETLTRAKADK